LAEHIGSPRHQRSVWVSDDRWADLIIHLGHLQAMDPTQRYSLSEWISNCITWSVDAQAALVQIARDSRGWEGALAKEVLQKFEQQE